MISVTYPIQPMVKRLDSFRAVDSNWRVPPPASFTAVQKRWVSLGGSLTARLAALGEVIVLVTQEVAGLAWNDERLALGLGNRERAWVRDVVLIVDGVPCIAAHSATPVRASRGVWSGMRQLRARPLAELLYADREVSRSQLASRLVIKGHPLHLLAAAQSGGHPSRGLVARRSVFIRRNVPLMVTECFLPQFWEFLARRIR